MKCNPLHFHLLAACMFTCLNVYTYATVNVTSANEEVASHQAPSNELTIKIISAPEKTYGYEVYQGTKLLIRQENIPGVTGMKGFKRKSDAEKVANLVMEKLKKGIMPPTVEKAEMEKLKVQF